MKKMVAAALLALASMAHAGIAVVDNVLQPSNGSEINPYDFGVLDGSPSVLLVTNLGTPGSSFEEYANFSITEAANVAAAANTYALSFMGFFNVVDIDDLSIEVWDGVHPNGANLIGTFSGDNVTTALGTLGAGQYHLDISGTFGAQAIGGQYSIALATVPAVPEPETYALMLAGLGAVAFVIRRRRPLA
jgi:hypothetical protein